MDKNMEMYKLKLLQILSRHVGRNRAISMPRLYEMVFDKPYNDKVSDTRPIRRLVTELRFEGVPILSTTSSAGGGYYLASAGSELDEYLAKLRKRALKILAMEAKIRKISLPELVGQLQLDLRRGGK